MNRRARIYLGVALFILGGLFIIGAFAYAASSYKFFSGSQFVLYKRGFKAPFFIYFALGAVIFAGGVLVFPKNQRS